MRFLAPRLPKLAGSDEHARALLELAHNDIEEGQPNSFDWELRQHAADPDVMVYTELRESIERAIDREFGEVSLDWTDEAIDGEVLWCLYRLRHGRRPCLVCFKTATRVDQIQPGETCRRHGTETAGAA